MFCFSIEADSSHMIETQLSGISIDDDLLDLLQSIEKQEPQEYEPPPRQSTFIEHYDLPNFYPGQIGISSNG